MKKNIKLGLVGASGKMGQSIRSCLPNSGIIPFVAVSSKPCDDFQFSIEHLNDLETDISDQVDIWIDFSSPAGLQQLLKMTAGSRKPILSGTTGLSPSDFKSLKLAAKKRPVFWASNMSPGLWALRQSLKALALVSDFKFKIDETHHTQKKDNPSGTALTLHSDLQKIINKKIAKPIGLRTGDVFGLHTISAESDSEVLTFQHNALNRSVFAQGALKAARWLVKKRPGFYSMEDLGEKK